MTATVNNNPVMITGASSGIGLELARHYAREGKALVLIARNEERLQVTAQELAQLNPIYGNDSTLITTLSLDVADADSVSQQLGECVQKQGVPQLLINAAGIVNVGRFLEMDRDYFDANLRIDFDGTVNVCRAIAPYMVKAGTGHIVNISSVAGYMGIYGYTGYSAAKYAVMGFSEALRFEMKPHGVVVSVVCPPDTRTPGFEAECAARPVETEAIAGTIKALEPELVARKIVRGIQSKRFYIIIGASSQFYFRLKGLVPEIFLAIVDRDVRKARKALAKTADSDLNIKSNKKVASFGGSAKTKASFTFNFGHLQKSLLHDIVSPSACLPEQNALNRGGLLRTVLGTESLRLNTRVRQHASHSSEGPLHSSTVLRRLEAGNDLCLDVCVPDSAVVSRV